MWLFLALLSWLKSWPAPGCPSEKDGCLTVVDFSVSCLFPFLGPWQRKGVSVHLRLNTGSIYTHTIVGALLISTLSHAPTPSPVPCKDPLHWRDLGAIALFDKRLRLHPHYVPKTSL